MTLAEVARTPFELRQLLGDTAPGLVPTMGALHAGHLTLIDRSALENDQTVVSIFVNPLQFNDTRDLAAYPRTFDEDHYRASEAGATISTTVSSSRIASVIAFQPLIFGLFFLREWTALFVMRCICRTCPRIVCWRGFIHDTILAAVVHRSPLFIVA